MIEFRPEGCIYTNQPCSDIPKLSEMTNPSEVKNGIC